MVKLKDYLSELITIVDVSVCSVFSEQFLVGTQTLGKNLFGRIGIC